MNISPIKDVVRGSRRWSLRVAQITAWGTVAAILGLVQFADLDFRSYRLGLLLVVAAVVWVIAMFRVIPSQQESGCLAWVVMIVNFGLAGAAFAIVGDDISSSPLIFVPVAVATGLITSLRAALVGAGIATGLYVAISATIDARIVAIDGVLFGALFLLSGGIAGLLSRELRTHFRQEQEEHRLATVVRLRLLAVLDAVDEAIIFRDRNGIVRVVNRRARDLFGLDSDEWLGTAGVELLRNVARQTEDPEGFMETFQELRDDPELELRLRVEQIIPERRQMRLYSAPTFDDTGILAGRIDVYTDVTESVQRAAEIERLYEDARKSAESYQRSLLPVTPPALPRCNVVAHYIAAAGRRAVCGDFYDFVQWPDGRMGFVLGDVCGIGPVAAADAALARYTLRALIGDESDPAELLGRLNSRIAAHATAERFVRMLLGVLDPERAVLEFVNAGHVPPIVYRADNGEIVRLEEGGLALGIENDTQYKVERIELDPGDMIMLYTDGVTEAPRDARPFGQGRLGDLVQEYGVGTPGELVQAIRRSVEAWVGDGELRDDLALLALQIVPDEVIGEPVRELVLPNDPARIGDVRAFVGAFLADVRAPVEVSHEILLAVGEAAANASRHGTRADRRTEIRILCVLDTTDVVITVADEGGGFEPNEASAELPDRFASGGRGLFLMRELMDDVAFESTPEGTTVKLRRRIDRSVPREILDR
jgi:serine phosphatase RsbU (regulator of sigma subunit)/anti-sigma regulatory factor (Ser/Thr protein kinase)